MGKKKKQPKSFEKRKKKIDLPKDKNGTSINVGDWIMFEDDVIHVYSLTVFDDGD